jgi:hypothetical protein
MAEFNKRPGSADVATRQNYFVLHSALNLVGKAAWEKAAWTTNQMYLKVVDKVSARKHGARNKGAKIGLW